MRTIHEPARETQIYDEVDVLVVGSGPAGHSAAMAASRAGVGRVGLVERFNHLGGMPTGGYVVYIPSLGYEPDIWRIYGIQKEWVERLKAHGGDSLIQPPEEDVGSRDPQRIHHWKSYFGFIISGMVSNSIDADPDMLKVVLDEMIEDENGRIIPYMQCWGVDAVMDGDTIRGVVIESKEGRRAIMAKVVIDATGDGDIAAFAGCDYEDDWDPAIRSSNLASCFRLGGVDFRKYADFKADLSAEELNKLNRGFKAMHGAFGPNAMARNDQAWINTAWLGSCMKIADLTKHDRDMRLCMEDYLKYVRQFPGMENAYLLDMAPQSGTRGGRRILCEYTLTSEEFDAPVHHEDVVMVTGRYTDRLHAPAYVPYRTMVPKQAENLLVTGRAYSSTAKANDSANVIPHCVIMGQAAGIAAAIAIADGVKTRDISIAKLHEEMRRQDMYVPEN